MFVDEPGAYALTVMPCLPSSRAEEVITDSQYQHTMINRLPVDAPAFCVMPRTANLLVL